MKKRTYHLKARALSQEETHLRITIAAMELHEELGPARTSLSAIAARAGVERLTVYRHFPDELSLFRACGGRYRRLHPPADPARWLEFPEADRLRLGLLELYRHFRETQTMWAHVLRDAEVIPLIREVAEPRFALLRTAAEILGRGVRGRLRRAAIGHAVQFRTWQSLANEGLDDQSAVELMIRLV
jgi:AcrR family transcriptional regulator